MPGTQTPRRDPAPQSPGSRLGQVKLTAGQATDDALAALKTARFGREHKRPCTVESWPLGLSSFGLGPELIRTQATVRKADLDDAVRALIVLPGAVTCAMTATTVSVDRAVVAA